MNFTVPILRYDIDLSAALHAEQAIRSGCYTQKDAETILGWNHFAAYNYVAQSHEKNCLAAVMDQKTLDSWHPDQYSAYFGNCGPLSMWDGQAMKKLGITSVRKDTRHIDKHVPDHVFNVTHFECIEGHKAYLTDHTMVQFFKHDSERRYVPGNHKNYDAVAQAFTENESVRALTSHILATGWMELNDETIPLYCSAFARAGNMLTGDVRDTHDFSVEAAYLLDMNGPRGSVLYPDADGLALPSQFKI